MAAAGQAARKARNRARVVPASEVEEKLEEKLEESLVDLKVTAEVVDKSDLGLVVFLKEEEEKDAWTATKEVRVMVLEGLDCDSRQAAQSPHSEKILQAHHPGLQHLK